jgi:hypothetical protein
MPNKHVRAAAPGLPNETDEVLALAERLGKAFRRDEELQRKSSAAVRAKGDSCAHTYLENAENDASDEVAAIRFMLAMTKATTPAGAAMQLAEALTLVDLVRDAIPADATTFVVKRDVRLLNRLIYSALAVLEEQAGRKVVDVVTPGYANPHMNPWTPVEDRITAVDAELRADMERAS